MIGLIVVRAQDFVPDCSGDIEPTLSFLAGAHRATFS